MESNSKAGKELRGTIGATEAAKFTPTNDELQGYGVVDICVLYACEI